MLGFSAQVFSPSSLGSFGERGLCTFGNPLTVCSFFLAFTIFWCKISGLFSHEQFVLLHSADLLFLSSLAHCLAPSVFVRFLVFFFFFCAGEEDTFLSTCSSSMCLRM